MLNESVIKVLKNGMWDLVQMVSQMLFLSHSRM